MIIKFFHYLFSAISSYIITIFDTVYHFISFFRYIDNFPDSLPSLTKFNLFSMKNLLKWFALLALVNLSWSFL